MRAQGVAQQPTLTLSRVRRIGSAGLNHIVIAGEGIAAYHAQLTPGTTAPLLVLDGNKAILNGVAVSGTVGLIPGDTLSIGEHNLRVSASGQDGDHSAGPDVEWRLVSGAGNASIALTDEVLIGSAATSAIRLKDPAIAAQHAQLAVRSGMLWLRDFSGGHTFVNAEPVNGARRLRHEDVLRIGSLDFRVVQEVPAADEPFDSITTVGDSEATGDPSVVKRAFVAEAPAAAEAYRSATAAEALSVEVTEVWRAAVFEVPTSDVPSPAVAGLHTAEPAFERKTRNASFGVPLLILSLTAAMAVAMWTPKLPIVERIADSRSVVDAWERTRATARSFEAAAVAWFKRETADMPRAPDATVVPQVADVEASTSTVIPFVASDLLDLQRKASSGDAAAIKRVEKLRAMYAELATSATVRGDSATAQRFTAMGELIGPTPATAETAVIASSAVPVEQPASPADALVIEARQLQSRGAASVQDGRSAVRILLEALTLQPGHAEARRDLNVE
ncbi:MAG TPA: FHA domain-containing protein, partial [Pseudomonadales bacterium]